MSESNHRVGKPGKALGLSLRIKVGGYQGQAGEISTRFVRLHFTSSQSQTPQPPTPLPKRTKNAPSHLYIHRMSSPEFVELGMDEYFALQPPERELYAQRRQQYKERLARGAEPDTSGPKPDSPGPTIEGQSDAAQAHSWVSSWFWMGPTLRR